MRKKSKSLTDEFFDKDDLQTVDFEITLAALLATATITFPVDGYRFIGELLAFSLLVLTLIRRMAVTSPFAPADNILGHTTPIISVISSCSIIYLATSILPTLQVVVRWGSPATILAISILIVAIVSVVVQEYIFRDYLSWWYVKFKQKEEKSERFEKVWLETAIIAYWASRARRHRESYKEFGKRLNSSRPDLGNVEFSVQDLGKYSLVVVILLGVLYLIPVIFSVYLFGLAGIWVVMAIVAVHDHSAFWYLAYGNPSYEDLRHSIPIITLRSLIYLGLVALLLS